jgi:hypothetical protein
VRSTCLCLLAWGFLGTHWMIALVVAGVLAGISSGMLAEGQPEEARG